MTDHSVSPDLRDRVQAVLDERCRCGKVGADEIVAALQASPAPEGLRADAAKLAASLRARLGANDDMPSLAGYRSIAQQGIDALQALAATPSEPEPPALDADRLARAMHAVNVDCNPLLPMDGRIDPGDPLRHMTLHRNAGAAIAAEYARLATPAPEEAPHE